MGKSDLEKNDEIGKSALKKIKKSCKVVENLYICSVKLRYKKYVKA
jgi:hypothetical protein